MPRTLVRFADLLALILAALLATPSVASAHARLKSSSPAAGETVRVRPSLLRLDFSESPEITLTSVQLRGVNGAVALGPLHFALDSHRSVIAAVNQALSAGTYTVNWQVVGDDGHPVRGSFDFTIAADTTTLQTPSVEREPSQRAGPIALTQLDSSKAASALSVESAPYIVVRLVGFIAIVLIVGATTFRLFVLAPFAREADAQIDEMRTDAERRAARVGVLAAVLLVADAAGRLLVQWLAVHDTAMPSGGGLIEMIVQTRWGWAWALQTALALVLAMVFAQARPGRRAPWALATGLALALAFTPSLSSHAAASSRLTGLALLADGGHVFGASGWLGSLALVLLAGIPSVIAMPEGQRAWCLARMVAALSPTALGCAALVAVTGTFAGWLHLGSLAALWQTPYGQTLLVKLAVVALVALAGAYNWRVVTPRLAGTDGGRMLRRSVRIELALGAVVLLVTAVLVALPTPMDGSM